MKLSHLALLGLAAAPLAAQNGIKLKNGTSNYLNVAYDSSIVPKSGITVEAWVTYDEKLGTGWRWPTICRQNPAAGREVFLMRVDAATSGQRLLRWYVRGTSGTLNVLWRFPTGTFSKFRHVAGTYDGKAAHLLVDGKIVASRTGSVGPLNDGGNVLKIGNGDGMAIENWNGEIDEFRLWPFARTPGEISQTMGVELQRVPGRVSTWNLNKSERDSSGGNNAKWVGTAQYATNSLKLTPLPVSGAFQSGKATKGCRGDSLCTISSIAQIGNAHFALVSSDGTPNGASVGLLAGKAASSPIKILGVDIWIDVTTLAGAFVFTASPLGTARMPLPIPNDSKLQNIGLTTQFLHLDPSCSKQTISSSPALRFSIR